MNDLYEVPNFDKVNTKTLYNEYDTKTINEYITSSQKSINQRFVSQVLANQTLAKNS